MHFRSKRKAIFFVKYFFIIQLLKLINHIYMIRGSACPASVCQLLSVSFCPACFEFVGCFWARGWVFLFVVCVCVCSCFRWSVGLYGSINRGQVFLLYPIPHGVYLSLYRLLYIEPAYLCAVVSKTLYFFDIFPVLSKF